MTTRARLTQLDGTDAGKVFPLASEVSKIGRLPGLEVPLEGEGISREHALIRRSLSGKHTLLDTGSRNGSFINGQPTRKPHRLKDGDEISIGEITLRFTLSQEGPEDWTSSETVSSNIDALLGRLSKEGTTPAMLVSSSGDSAGQVYRLDQPRFVLGRDDDADAQIRDAGISRKHAVVSAMAGNTYVLEDLGSSNGTFANQERIVRPHILRDGDMIQLGTETVLRFISPGEGSPERATGSARRASSTAAIDEKDLEKDLALARKVQTAMVPPNGALFDTPGAQFVGVVRSARFAAGDIWTHVDTDSGLVLLIADVTGHGVAPAMIATVAKSCLDTVLLRASDFSIEQAFDTMNRVILGITKQNLAMTAFAVQIDRGSQQLSFCSAGHVPQLLLERRDEGPPEITPLSTAETVPLGQSPDSRFVIQTRDYNVGDRLLLFTDGLLELRSPDGTSFGNRRLHDFLRGNSDLEIKQLLDAVLAEADRFAGDVSPEDDVTVVAVELGGTPREPTRTSPGFPTIRED